MNRFTAYDRAERYAGRFDSLRKALLSAGPEGRVETTKKSSELVAGDVVRTHGMRVRLGEVKLSSVHPDDHNGIHYSVGEILNLEAVLAERFVPAGFIADGKWTVQANDLVSWVVEVDAELCNDCRRPITYDYSTESYRHLENPERGCFLIRAELPPRVLERDRVLREAKAKNERARLERLVDKEGVVGP